MTTFLVCLSVTFLLLLDLSPAPIQYDFILILNLLYLPRLYFQMRSHSQDPGDMNLERHYYPIHSTLPTPPRCIICISILAFTLLILTGNSQSSSYLTYTCYDHMVMVSQDSSVLKQLPNLGLMFVLKKCLSLDKILIGSTNFKQYLP